MGFIGFFIADLRRIL